MDTKIKPELKTVFTLAKDLCLFKDFIRAEFISCSTIGRNSLVEEKYMLEYKLNLLFDEEPSDDDYKYIKERIKRYFSYVKNTYAYSYIRIDSKNPKNIHQTRASKHTSIKLGKK